MSNPQKNTKSSTDGAAKSSSPSTPTVKVTQAPVREDLPPVIDPRSRAFMLEYFNKYLESDRDELNVDNFKKCLIEIGWLDVGGR